MLIIGTVAMVMSYGTFSALGQSTQLNRWQIQTSASSGLSAWKINTETGIAYYCAASAFQCIKMDDK
jgi:hypothetical protein